MLFCAQDSASSRKFMSPLSNRTFGDVGWGPFVWFDTTLQCTIIPAATKLLSLLLPRLFQTQSGVNMAQTKDITLLAFCMRTLFTTFHTSALLAIAFAPFASSLSRTLSKSCNLTMVGISLKSKVSSPSRFALRRNKSQTKKKQAEYIPLSPGKTRTSNNTI